MANKKRKSLAKKRAVTAAEAVQNRTAKKRAAFLMAYVINWNVSKAAAAAQVGRQTVYDWLKEDQFRRAFEDADLAGADGRKEEANRRAVQGVQRLKFHEGSPIMVPDPSGKMVPHPNAKMIFNEATGQHELPLTPAMVPYVEHQYSDTLLIFLMKADDPEKYRENSTVEHKGGLDVKLTGAVSALPAPEEALKRLAELAKRLPKKPQA